MKIRIFHHAVAFLGLSLLASPLIAQMASTADKATVTVFVKYDDGNPANQAPVYINGDRKHQIRMMQANDSGSTRFEMVPGDYQVSSAYIRGKTLDGFKERYISNAAKISVAAGENTIVVLTLKPLADPDNTPLSAASLHEMGILSDSSNNPSALAKNY